MVKAVNFVVYVLHNKLKKKKIPPAILSCSLTALYGTFDTYTSTRDQTPL